jgi:addiction module HigA family antidote
MAKKKKLPPVHPGEVLREDYLIPAAVTVNALALALRMPVSRIYEIVNRTRAITPETALRLARGPARNSGWAYRPTTISKRRRRNSKNGSSARFSRASAQHRR